MARPKKQSNDRIKTTGGTKKIAYKTVDVNKVKEGRQFARALFKEYHNPETDNCTPIYSFDEFHKVFIEEMDVTEYRPAMRLVGDWNEWQRLKRDWSTFNFFIDNWKAEVETRLTSLAIQKLHDLIITGENNQALTAAKWVAENNWNKREKGRPSKKEMDAQAKEIARAAAETKEEENRILKVLNGGKSKEIVNG